MDGSFGRHSNAHTDRNQHVDGNTDAHGQFDGTSVGVRVALLITPA